MVFFWFSYYSREERTKKCTHSLIEEIFSVELTCGLFDLYMKVSSTKTDLTKYKSVYT